MLIWLEGTPKDYPLSLDAAALSALTELGEAGYKSRHVIACSRELAKHLGSLDPLSPRAKAYFFRIYGEYTQLGHVFSSPNHIVASLEAVTPNVVARTWRVPIRFFSDDKYVEELTVVCENDTDYEIYCALAKSWMTQNLPSCVVSARSRAGHGGSTVTVLRRLAIDANPIYLCLLDSDREVAGGREGPTARGVRNAWIPSWRSALVVLDCRELENALPTQAVERCLESLGRHCPEYEHVQRIHEDLAMYVCMKTGEDPCRFHSVERAHVGYARTRHALLQTSASHPGFGNCGNECGECNCKIIPALGERFLDAFAQWLRQIHPTRALPNFTSWPADAIAAAEIFACRAMALPRRQ